MPEKIIWIQVNWATFWHQFIWINSTVYWNSTIATLKESKYLLDANVKGNWNLWVNRPVFFFFVVFLSSVTHHSRTPASHIGTHISIDYIQSRETGRHTEISTTRHGKTFWTLLRFRREERTETIAFQLRQLSICDMLPVWHQTRSTNGSISANWKRQQRRKHVCSEWPYDSQICTRFCQRFH